MTPEEKAKKDLLELQKLADQLGYSVNNLWSSDPLKYVNEITTQFIKWDDELNNINSDLEGLVSLMRANLQEISKSNVAINNSRSAMRGVISLTQQLANDRQKIVDLDKKQLENLLEKSKIRLQELKRLEDEGNLTSEQLNNVQEFIKLNEQLVNQTRERLDFEKEIQKTQGLSTGIATTMQGFLKKVGATKLSDQLGLDDAIKKNREFVKDQLLAINNGEKSAFGSSGLVNNLKSAGNLVKNLGSNLLKSLGPAALLIGLVEALLDLDKSTGDMAKQFGISYNEASKLNQEVNAIAFNTSDIFIDAQSLNKSFMQLSSALGTNTMLSKEMLTTFTELTERAGYSVEAATTLSKLSLITNKSSKDLATTYLGQVKLLNIKNGLAINEKALLNDISNVSKATLITFSKNPQELAKASFEAKKLGLELKDLEKVGHSLLDIESSINKEFEAEQFIGRELNLEKARMFALTKNYAGLAQEINKQGITASSFANNMNTIQQEALADAFGLSADEMANMLMEGEALKKVGADSNKDAKEKFDLLVKQVGMEQAIKQFGDEQLANQLNSVSQQEKFQKMLSKLQDIFTQIAEPLIPVLEIFGDLFELIGPLGTLISKNLGVPLNAIKVVVGFIQDAFIGIKGLITGKGFGDFGLSNTKSSLKGLGSAMNESLGGEAFKMVTGKNVLSIDDGEIDSKGGLVVSGPKGSIQMDNNDTFIGNKNGVVAGTDLFNNNSNPSSNLLGNKMDIMINKLDNLISAVNKGMVVNLDGNKVSQELLSPLSLNDRRI